MIPRIPGYVFAWLGLIALLSFIVGVSLEEFDMQELAQHPYLVNLLSSVTGFCTTASLVAGLLGGASLRERYRKNLHHIRLLTSQIDNAVISIWNSRLSSPPPDDESSPFTPRGDHPELRLLYARNPLAFIDTPMMYLGGDQGEEMRKIASCSIQLAILFEIDEDIDYQLMLLQNELQSDFGPMVMSTMVVLGAVHDRLKKMPRKFLRLLRLDAQYR